MQGQINNFIKHKVHISKIKDILKKTSILNKNNIAKYSEFNQPYQQILLKAKLLQKIIKYKQYQKIITPIKQITNKFYPKKKNNQEINYQTDLITQPLNDTIKQQQLIFPSKFQFFKYLQQNYQLFITKLRQNSQNKFNQNKKQLKNAKQSDFSKYLEELYQLKQKHPNVFQTFYQKPFKKIYGVQKLPRNAYVYFYRNKSFQSIKNNKNLSLKEYFRIERQKEKNDKIKKIKLQVIKKKNENQQNNSLDFFNTPLMIETIPNMFPTSRHLKKKNTNQKKYYSQNKIRIDGNIFNIYKF